MDNNLKLLRYNTGTDKQVLIQFKNDFSAVIFNATIVAYSKSAVADLVSVHKNQYIIDPQTHIYQQSIEDVRTQSKSGEFIIKKSVIKYLDELPSELKSEFISRNGCLPTSVLSAYIDSLVDAVYDFETSYVNQYVKSKEYDKYLEFAQIGPKAAVAIAPYFMIKSSYTDFEINDWITLNAKFAKKFIQKNNGNYPVGVQIVLDKQILVKKGFVKQLCKAYQGINAEFVFIWIDEFDLFATTNAHRIAFKELLMELTALKMKPIMAYGGYDAILLCHNDLPYRMHGVAQSVGYGENRAVTPVGGGLPVNKYYFYPLHDRLKMSEASGILRAKGFFSMDSQKASELFYSTICNCKQCKSIIKNNIDNFNLYNAAIDFTMKNGIKRNRPTTEATLIAAKHFMYSKVREWESLERASFNDLKEELISNYRIYNFDGLQSINDWCKIYD